MYKKLTIQIYNSPVSWDEVDRISQSAVRRSVADRVRQEQPGVSVGAVEYVDGILDKTKPIHSWTYTFTVDLI